MSTECESVYSVIYVAYRTPPPGLGYGAWKLKQLLTNGAKKGTFPTRDFA